MAAISVRAVQQAMLREGLIPPSAATGVHSAASPYIDAFDALARRFGSSADLIMVRNGETYERVPDAMVAWVQGRTGEGRYSDPTVAVAIGGVALLGLWWASRRRP